MYKNLRIFKAIKKYSFDYAIANFGELPHPELQKSLKCALDADKIKRYIKVFSVRAVCDKLLTYLPNKYYWLLGITPAKYYIVGGVSALKADSERYITDKTTIIYAHSMDYDRYLEMDLSLPDYGNIFSKYCVFIDEYYPYHPDFALDMGKSPCTEEKYYPVINQFFDYIEQQFGLKVIIAAHPRADYNLHPNAYPNRTIISGKTNYLIREADLVITHASTANSYAIMFKKPMLFITTNEINEKDFQNYPYLVAFARYFGQPIINIDKDYSSLCEIPKIDTNIYDKYINDYIKIKGSPNKKIWNIFIDEIEKV